MFFNHKSALIRQLEENPDPAALRNALDELRTTGKLTDGSLRGIELPNSYLSGVNLEGAVLTDASLIGAQLQGANLRNAILLNADLSSADLTDANLEGANLSGTLLAEANLTRATYTEALLTRAGALIGATMPDGTRYDGRYDLAEDMAMAREEGIYPDQWDELAEWYGVERDAFDSGLDWAEVNLQPLRVRAQYILSGPPDKWSVEARRSGALTDGSLKGEDLRRHSLAHADLRNALLTDCILGTEADHADFTDADLSDADMEEIDLHGADLTRTNLRGAYLQRAKLNHALLISADLTEADLSGAKFDHADLTGATIAEAQLLTLYSLTRATMPDGTRYDGRYDLVGDIDAILDNGVDLDSAEEVAHWYDITVEQYEAGQAWAEANLPDLDEYSEE